jgi:type I restriction enzyme S subunit
LVLDPAEDTVASTGFAVLRAREVPFSYLLASVTTDAFVDYLTSHATGAAYPAVKQSDFEKAEFMLPERQLVEAFDRTVEPMLRYVHKLDQKNTNLRAQRDLLLPQLVSGEIDVTGAEAALEAAE